MNSTQFKKSSGFTLIETLLYLALFTIVIGGGMVAAYNIIQATDANTNHVVLQEEANFLYRKIDWAITGSTAVSTGATNPSSTLTITKNGTLTFDYDSTNHAIRFNGVPLNSNNVRLLIPPSFQKITLAGKPDEIITIFSLATAQNGRGVSQDFSFTKYLRQ